MKVPLTLLPSLFAYPYWFPLYKFMRANRSRLRNLINRVRNNKRAVVQEAELAIAFVHASTDVLSAEPRAIKRSFARHVEILVDFGGLIEIPDFSTGKAYQITALPSPTAEEFLCCLDPFSYISHLSSMSWHGLTDRIPRTIFASRPDAKSWRHLANKKLEHDLGELYALYTTARLPRYRPPKFTKIFNRPVNIWTSSRIGTTFQAAFRIVSDEHLQVSTIGRCFLDMVREPSLCGGIHHVIEVYRDHAAPHLEAIISEIEAHGTKIEQARAGYLIENEARLKHNMLDKWASQVSRGGTRKLDPSTDFSERFSERWSISLNA